MKSLTRSLVALPLLAIALGAGAPVYASAVVEGDVFFNSLPFLFDTGPQAGSPVSDVLNPWSYACSSCAGYGISGNGAANVINGSLGASSSVTVTGAPGSNAFIEADGVANYADMLTISGGTGTGVLAMTYTLTGAVSQTGTGTNESDGYLLMAAAGYYSFNGGPVTSTSNGVQIMVGNGPQSYPLIYYIQFTYGTAFAIDPALYTNAIFSASLDTTPYTGTVNFYDTAMLDSALVYAGTPLSLGAQNNAANISSSSGLNYGPNGISATPEPSSWFLLASGIGLLAFARRRGAFRPVL